MNSAILIIVLYTMLLSVNAFAALSTDASEKYYVKRLTFDKEGYFNIVVHTEDMKPNEIRVYVVEVK